jgi:hypothetical protein
VTRIIPLRPHVVRPLTLNTGASALLPDCGRDGSTIRTDAVYAVYTSPEPTLIALRTANAFANAMGVPLTLLHLRAVPYNWPIDAPSGISPIQTASFSKRLCAAALEPRIAVHLCRDERDAIALALKPHSLVVIGSDRHWWQRAAERWRHMLEAAGHFVVIAAAEDLEGTAHA